MNNSMTSFILILMSATFLFAADIPCQIEGRVVGYSNGEDLALWNSLVSKMAGEQLSPLAIPHPIRPLPVSFLNPNNQSYYQSRGYSEYLQDDVALSAMSLIQKAKEQGLKLFVHSGYRSYKTQCDVFKKKVSDEVQIKKVDLETAIKSVNTRSAFPGGSEHQLATAIDFVTDIPGIGYKLEFEFYRTSTYQWLQENAVEYGFVLSFPISDDTNFSKPHPKTQIIFEPWHWRYVGVHYARLFKQCRDQLTLQEFLRELKRDSNFRCQ